MASGECNCGSVRYEIKTEVRDVYQCHCSICRSATGSGGIAVVVVKNKDFEWLEGQENITHWAKPGHDWHTSFCKTCGSNLPGKNDEEHMYVPVGTLKTGHENLKIKQHLFTDSKGSWEVITES